MHHLVNRQDGNRSNLRNAAYEALGELIKYSPRVSQSAGCRVLGCLAGCWLLAAGCSPPHD